MRKLFASLLLLAGATFATGAAAQVPPYVYPVTLGTSSIQVLPVNPLRKRVIFTNQSGTGLIAVCPLGPARNTGTIITAVVNGAGCVTLVPYGSFTLDNGEGSGAPPLSIPSAWVGVANAAASPLTMIEFE
jgi:flavoprotein